MTEFKASVFVLSDPKDRLRLACPINLEVWRVQERKYQNSTLYPALMSSLLSITVQKNASARHLKGVSLTSRYMQYPVGPALMTMLMTITIRGGTGDCLASQPLAAS